MFPESTLHEEDSPWGRGGQHSGGGGRLPEPPRCGLCPTPAPHHPPGFNRGSCANQVCIYITGSHGKPEQVPWNWKVHSHPYVRWGKIFIVVVVIIFFVCSYNYSVIVSWFCEFGQHICFDEISFVIWARFYACRLWYIEWGL